MRQGSWTNDSRPDPRLEYLLGEVRRLTAEYQEGKDFRPVGDLINLLVRATVLRDRHPGLKLWDIQTKPEKTAVLGGTGNALLEPLPLSDNRFLRVTISLFIEKAEHGPRIKVVKSAFQYQLDSDPDSKRWVFRYDYSRFARDPHAQAHLQINGRLNVDKVLPAQRPLERVHFPTRRMPIEGVIRLLAEEFEVPCAEPPTVWRRLLTEAEEGFLRVMHEPPLGPAK